MTIHDIFSLFGTFLCFSLAIFVLFKNYDNVINKIFALLCFTFSYWSFCNFQIHQAETLNRAQFWITISGLWPFSIAFLLHFILVYCKKIDRTILKLIMVINYFCAVAISYVNIFIIDYKAAQFSWGWGLEFSKSILFDLSKIWAITIAVFSIIVLLNYSIKNINSSVRKQTSYILLGISVVFICGAIGEIILPFLSIRIPELISCSFTLMAAFVGWAIWRHQLFTLDPSTAAETIIKTMSDSLAVVNLNHEIEIVNRALLVTLGYSEEELIGQDLSKIIGPFKYQNSTLTTILKNDSLTDIETTLKKKDGSLIPTSLSWSVLKEKNRFRGFVFIARDMSERERIKGALQKAYDELEKRVEERTTELKRSNEQLTYEISERISAEKKLADEKERLSATLKSIGDGVITTDNKGTIVLLNKAAENLIECSLENIIGENLDKIYKTQKLNPRIPYNTTIFEEINSNHYFSTLGRQSVLYSISGKEYIIFESGVPIKDHVNNISGYVIVFRDITEKYHLEEELFKARKLESISLLASGIAHDFNNLLTGIITNLFMAKMGINTETDTYQMITTAEKAAFQASTLTRQLLTFSKNCDTATKEETSIKELIENSIGFYLKNSKSEYRIDIPECIYKISVDRGQIDKALHNIILNADQAMPEGGMILVAAENITIDSHNQALPLTGGDYVKICITDQGQGIPNENLLKIFDPYFTTKIKGTGLGLTSAYSIVQKHGGHISVNSQLSKGTTFTIYLPASVNTISDSSTDKPGISKGRGKVLFVDDEQFILKSTGQILEHLGYAVSLAENSQDTIDLFKEAFNSECHFTVVIIDLTISGGSGAKEVVSELLEIDPEAKVIVSSGYTNDPIMLNYASYGFSGAIPKPYNIEDLNSKIQEIIELENSTV